jgi:hypothetical protein
MIETELENSGKSVILNRKTFNAQPAFGKPAARQASTFTRRIPTVRQ